MPTEEHVTCRLMTAILADAPHWWPKPLRAVYEPHPLDTTHQMLNMMSVKSVASLRPDADRDQLIEALYTRGTGVRQPVQIA